MTMSEKKAKIKEVEEQLKVGGVPKAAKIPSSQKNKIVTKAADLKQICEKEKNYIEAGNKVSAKPEISDIGIRATTSEPVTSKTENEVEK